MTLLLALLAIPLLLLPWLAPPTRRGATVAQLLFVIAGLGALWQGAATLDPIDLHALTHQSSGDAWFVGITAGAMLLAVLLYGDLLAVRQLLAAPLVAGLLYGARGAWGPLLVGMVIAAGPWLLGRILPRARVAEPLPPARPDRIALMVALAAVALLGWGPMPFGIAAVVALLWWDWRATERTAAIDRLPLWPAVATTALAAWLWFAMTVADAPWAPLRRFASDAPISDAAALWFAVLAFAAALAASIRWPGTNRRNTLVPVVIAIAFHLVGPVVAPDAMAHWQPIATTGLVGAALLLLARGRWIGVTIALMLLAASRPGNMALASAVLIAGVPLLVAYRLADRIVLTLASVAGGLVVVVVMRDQVVLGLVLLIGTIVLLERPERVAPVAESSHV